MIPVHKTLEITLEQLRQDNTLTDRTQWTPEQIVNLWNICLETHFKTFQRDIFTQKDGTPIGKSISGPLAGIFVAWFEKMFVMKGKFKARIIFLQRMKDDVLFIWRISKKMCPESFNTFLNSIEPRIQFTLEMDER